MGNSVQQPDIIDLNLFDFFFSHCYIHGLDSLHGTGGLAFFGFGLLVGLFDFLEQVLVLPLDLQVLGLEHLVLFGVLLKERSVGMVGIVVKMLQKLGLGPGYLINFKFMYVHPVRDLLFFEHVLEERFGQMG